MTTLSPGFYVTGGTLRPDAPSYLERQADRDLYDGLLRGDFCYVLTARQMGKSSLMVRTAVRLRQEGVAAVVLDLTAIGQNLTAEQWYDGLRDLLGQQLDLEEELEAFWQEQARLGPLQRWMKALREVVLPCLPGRLVIFVDEIDAVRSLPFSTDEFFAAIRECFNRRTEDPEFARLTFCLLGVASPSDLIRDTRTTPFNIGRRIELTDFSAAEAAPLAEGLGRKEPAATRLLKRVLYWTGGHPYLTQQLCHAAAEHTEVQDPVGVDRLCDARFLTPRARERDDNLLFVRERLLRTEADLAGLLDLYAQVRDGRRVADDETNPLVSLLRLSGITRGVNGSLRVRNRIYERVFDRAWVQAHMPDAELRRQQAAYRRGLLRAIAVSALVLIAVGSLALAALDQAYRANRVSRSEAQQRRVAEARRLEARRNLYAARVNLAQQRWEEGNVGRAWELLDACRPEPGDEDLRSFEWRYLWRRCRQNDQLPRSGYRGPVTDVAFSPNGKILAASSGDTVVLRDAATGREIAALRASEAPVYAIAFSRDGRRLAAGDGDRTVRLWDVASRRRIAALRGHAGPIHALAFFPDGKTVASGSLDHTVKLWDIASRRVIATIREPTVAWHALAPTPDGKTLAIGTQEDLIRLWDPASRRVRATLKWRTGVASRGWLMRHDACVAFSPDGRLLAGGSRGHVVKLWDVRTKREVGTLWGQAMEMTAVAFSPDGRTLATGGQDTTLTLWDVGSRREVATFCGHQEPLAAVAFSPDGKKIASASWDRTLRLWDVASRTEIHPRMAHLAGAAAGRSSREESARGSAGASPLGEQAGIPSNSELPFTRQGVPVSAVAFSPPGGVLATGSGDGSVRLWHLGSRREIARLKRGSGSIRRVVFSPDGKTLAAGSSDETVTLWDLTARRVLATLPGYAPWNLPGSHTIAFSPDGRLLSVGCTDRTVKLWDLSSRRQARVLPAFPGGVFGVAFSPDGRLLAAGGADTDGIGLWEVPSWRTIGRLRDVPRFGPLIFSPDGATLVTAAGFGNLKLSDVASRRTIAILKTQMTDQDSFALSPDGKTLAVTGVDAIRLWNLAIRREVVTLKGHRGPVYAMAFSPDGTTLASAGADGTVRLWRAAPFQETDPLQILLAGAGDRRVTLQWRPLSWAVGYNVYRGPDGAPTPALRKLNPQPVAGDSYTDQSPDLVNGRPQSYAIVAMYARAGRIVEGARVSLHATPAAVPPGFQGCSIQEGPRFGSVAFDAVSGRITLRGAGEWIWETSDSFYYLCRPMSGDFQITVRALTVPTEVASTARAGLMVRDSLAAGARNVYLFTMPRHGLVYQWRTTTNEPTDSLAVIQRPWSETTILKLPILMRLTRRGSTVVSEYSQDDGRSFQPADDPLPFQPGLPETVYAGLAISSQDRHKITEATFDRLEAHKR